MKAPPSTRAVCRPSPRSIASTATTVSRLPTCSADCPHTRTKLVQKITAQATGTTTGSPSGRSSPNPAVSSPPSAANASSAGTRRRIGPPASHRQVSRAASAASFSGGKSSHSLAATSTATDRAARTPSATDSARRSRLTGRRLRSASGPRLQRLGRAMRRSAPIFRGGTPALLGRTYVRRAVAAEETSILSGSEKAELSSGCADVTWPSRPARPATAEGDRTDVHCTKLRSWRHDARVGGISQAWEDVIPARCGLGRTGLVTGAGSPTTPSAPLAPRLPGAAGWKAATSAQA